MYFWEIDSPGEILWLNPFSGRLSIPVESSLQLSSLCGSYVTNGSSKGFKDIWNRFPVLSEGCYYAYVSKEKLCSYYCLSLFPAGDQICGPRQSERDRCPLHSFLRRLLGRMLGISSMSRTGWDRSGGKSGSYIIWSWIIWSMNMKIITKLPEL